MVETETTPPHPPRFKRCECVIRLDILQNVERSLTGLSEAPPVPSSPLTELEEENVWVTAGDEFLAHLRHVAVRKPITWMMKVISDAELTTAWLASIALEGKDILDADAYKISTRYITLVDLVHPPDLLVIRMGVKAARNSAAPEVLQEAIQTRLHEGKPTWLWDEPHHPLNPGHLFWSDSVGRVLSNWTRFTSLDVPKSGGSSGDSTKKKSSSSSSARMRKKTLRGG
jgi:hypothetical protein